MKNVILTHNWNPGKGWLKTIATPNDFDDIVHFGTNCEGEIFVARCLWDGKSVVYKGFYEPIDVRIVRGGEKTKKSNK